MPRVKRGVTAHAKHKKVIRQAKGFRGRRGNVFNIAKEAVMKAQSTPTAIASSASVSSAHCGSRASMQPCESTA